MIAGSSRPRVFTHANLLLATGLYVGEQVRVSDVGVNGSTWTWTETLFAPINGSYRHHRLAAPVTGANNSNAQVLDYAVFPSGLLADGDELEVFVRFNKSGSSDTVTFKLLFGNTFDTTENNVLSLNLTTTSAQMAGSHRFRMVGTTLTPTDLALADPWGASSTNSAAGRSYDPAYPAYVSVFGQRTSGTTETFTLSALSIRHHK